MIRGILRGRKPKSCWIYPKQASKAVKEAQSRIRGRLDLRQNNLTWCMAVMDKKCNCLRGKHYVCSWANNSWLRPRMFKRLGKPYHKLIDGKH